MTNQNRSTAVMARRAEPHNSLDDFPTQPWAGRALVEHVLQPTIGQSHSLQSLDVWEPACNRGHLAHGLKDYFRFVYQSDIFDYSNENPEQESVRDFLFPFSESPQIATNGIDGIITNPPFRLAAQFIHRAHQFNNVKFIAMFVRTAFLEGIDRYHTLFSVCPPAIVAQFAERVPLVKGRIDRTAATATAYCWIVWLPQQNGEPRLLWIPPCRGLLERDEDYLSFGGAA